MTKVTELADKVMKLPSPGIAIVKMAIADTPEKKAAAMKEGEAILDKNHPRRGPA
jgi:hypothetical protein